MTIRAAVRRVYPPRTMRRSLSWTLMGALGLATSGVAGTSWAQTGVCDSTATSPSACINAIQASGGVVNDIFTDANGLTAQELPVYGVLFNAWPNCPGTSFAG